MPAPGNPGAILPSMVFIERFPAKKALSFLCTFCVNKGDWCIMTMWLVIGLLIRHRNRLAEIVLD